MNARLFPFNDKVFSGFLDVMADALSHTAFAPGCESTVGERVDAPPSAPRVGLWERLDRWAWSLAQKDREAYLSRAQNLADLEDRIRRLESSGARYY